MFKTVTIIGDGGMGSVCAMLLCENGVRTTLWGHEAAYIAEMAHKRENVRFLPGYKLPDSLRLEADDSRAFDGAELVVSAVPCQFLRKTWQRLAAYLPAGIPMVSVTKGIEIGTLRRPTEILREVLGTQRPYAVLSGPTIADEVAQGLPATATVASENSELARAVQQTFNTAMFRVYTHDDCVVVELAGDEERDCDCGGGVMGWRRRQMPKPPCCVAGWPRSNGSGRQWGRGKKPSQV